MANEQAGDMAGYALLGHKFIMGQRPEDGVLLIWTNTP